MKEASLKNKWNWMADTPSGPDIIWANRRKITYGLEQDNIISSLEEEAHATIYENANVRRRDIR